MISYALCAVARDLSGNLADSLLRRGRRGAGSSIASRNQKEGAELAKTALAAAVNSSSLSDTFR